MLNQAAHRRHQQALEISSAALGEISGIHRNRLSLYLSGTSQLPNTEIVHLEKTFQELDELVRLADPYPLSFQNTTKIKDLLVHLRAGDLKVKSGKD